MLASAAILALVISKAQADDAQDHLAQADVKICMETEKLTEVLRSEYDEFPFITGSIENGTMQVYVSSDQRTFTVTVERTPGLSCIVGAGFDIRLVKLFRINRGDPT
jgi:hypothetical protein